MKVTILKIMVLVLVLTLFSQTTQGELNTEDFNKTLSNINITSKKIENQGIPETLLLINEELSQIDLTDYLDLEIKTQRTTYKYSGKIIFPIRFHYLEEDYSVILKNKETKEIIYEKDFLLENKTIVNKNNLSLFLEKEKYFLTEEINIFIQGNQDLLEYAEVIIKTNDKSYRSTVMKNELIFIPIITGEYSVTLYYDNESVTKNFSVKEITEDLSEENNGEEKSVIEHDVKEESTQNIHGQKLFELRNHANYKKELSAQILNTAFGRLVRLNNPINNIERITFSGLNENKHLNFRIEDREPVLVNGVSAKRSFAIDPTNLDFEYATITNTALGNALYECKDYDFENQICFGHWNKIRDLIPGKSYSFKITPEDPIYSELNETIDCSCSFTQTSRDATIGCNTGFCEYTIQIPEDATSFFLESMIYEVDVTMISEGTITGGSQEGYFDHDETLSNGNEILIGSSNVQTSQTLTWTNNNIDETGSQSFSPDTCDTWEDNYCTGYIYLGASLTFTTPGNSQKLSTVGISLNSLNYSINYTVPGSFAVILESPDNNFYTNNTFPEFSYIPTSEDSIINNCSIYTTENGWDSKNTSTSINNGTTNYFNVLFGNEGQYDWNVICWDENDAQETGVNNRTIIIDTTSPVVSLINPAHETTITDSNVVTFYFNVTDDSPINNCSIMIDGEAKNTIYDVEKDVEIQISQSLDSGTYNWSIMCYDAAGNYNVSEEREITIDIVPVIFEGLWYETHNQDCTIYPCEIGLAQETDGTPNNVGQGSLPSGDSLTMVEATSPFIGSNGAHVPSGSTVTFSTFFSQAQGNLDVRWYLYKQDELGQNTLICNHITAGVIAPNGGAVVRTCDFDSDKRILSTDKLFYEITLTNTHNVQPRTFTHTVDHDSSFVNIADFVQVGSLSTSLVEPTSEVFLGQNEVFNLTCNVTCTYGTCLDTSLYAQSNHTGTWQNIASSGPVHLESGVNPVNVGDVFNTTVEETFSLEGVNPGPTHIRCYVADTYSTSFTDTVRVEVLSDQPPTVNLNTPANNTWVNTADPELVFTPLTFDTISSCDLYLDGIFHSSNTSPITRNVQNSFFVSGLDQKNYDWMVSCTDSQDREGNSSVFTFFVDYDNPSLNLINPEDNFITPNPEVFFNWTAYDNRADQITCDLYVEGIIRDTLTQANNTVFNSSYTVSGIGEYTWSVTCTDEATNTNTSGTRTFNVTDESPVINLNEPINNGGVNTTSPTLFYTPNDYFGLQSCDLYINGVFNQSNSSPIINQDINNFTVTGLIEDSYSWSVNCTDLSDNIGYSSTWDFYVDLTPPSIVLNTPLNESFFTTPIIEFSYTPTDNWNPLTCTIYVDDQPNITTSTTSGTTVTETGIGYADGDREWYVSCTDIGGNTAQSEVRWFNVNETPTITLDSPDDEEHTNEEDVDLFYTVFDNDGISSCDLYVNGLLNQSSTDPIISGEQNNFSLTGLNPGYYNWSINCTDTGIYSNEAISETYEFVVDNTAPSITLFDPVESQIVETRTHFFKWNVTDDYSDEMFCDIYINNTLNVSNVLSLNNSISNISISGFQTNNYDWHAVCRDKANNSVTSPTINFQVILSPRTILIAPINESGVQSPITFTYIPTDGSGDFERCELYIDGVLDQVDENIDYNVENNFTKDFLEDGRYDWDVNCTDINGLTGGAEEEEVFYVDTVPPYYLELFNPENDTLVEVNRVPFQFTVRDETSPEMTCDIYVGELDEPDPTPNAVVQNLAVENDTLFTYEYDLPDGNYSWFVFCEDKSSLFIESNLYYFEVIAPPEVLLISPENFSWFNIDSLDLIYYPIEDYGLDTCELYVNGVLNQTTTPLNPPISRQNNTFTLTNLEVGEYNWTVKCDDVDGKYHIPPNFTFYVDQENPTMNLNAPILGEILNNSSVLFNWTAEDDLSHTLFCNLSVNGSLMASNIEVNNSEPHTELISGLTDGLFEWFVSCSDLANNNNISITETFEVQESPSIILENPADNFRTNMTSQSFFFTPFDNSGQIQQCTLLLNGEPNETLNVVNHGFQNNITVNTLEGGSYEWDVNCSDFNNNWGLSEAYRNLHIDLFPPVMTLFNPEPDEIFNMNDIFFEWGVEDFNSSVLVNCSLYITDPSGDRFITDITGFSGQNLSHTELNLEDNDHYWNVTCTDDLGNVNTSETRLFYINSPDLYINKSQIIFNNTNPNLADSINITANVSNIGGRTAENVLVEFWKGDPNSGGIFIDNDTKTVDYNSHELFSVNWVIEEGLHEIYVLVDPNNEIDEMNETNNNASKNISVLSSVINNPLNNSYFNTLNVPINFTLTDYTNDDVYFNIFVNGSIISSGTTTDNVSTIETLTLFEGQNVVAVEATDLLGRKKNSTEIILFTDTIPPIVSFEDPTPLNNHVQDSQSAIINVSHTERNPDTLIFDFNGSITTQTYNGAWSSFSLNDLQDGIYYYDVWVNDTVGWTNTTETRILRIDLTAPIINLISPLEGETITSSVTEFSFEVEDSSQYVNCSLYLDEEFVEQKENLLTNTINNFVMLLNDGSYNYSISCTDQLGRTTNTSTINFSVEATAPEWTGMFYETSESNFVDETANIGLAILRDNTENTITTDIFANELMTVSNATSSFISGHGAIIYSNASVDFSGVFMSTGRDGFVTWKAYLINESGPHLMSQSGNDGSQNTGNNRVFPFDTKLTLTGSSTLSQDWLVKPTDKIRLTVNVYNNDVNGFTQSFTHYWDDRAASYLSFTEFELIGHANVSVVDPSSPDVAPPNEEYEITCEITCDFGTCYNTEVYAQYSGLLPELINWTNVSDSGNLVLWNTQENPVFVGNISEDTNVTFSVNGTTASDNLIRCFAVTDYNEDYSQEVSLSVEDTISPNVTLISPPNETHTNEDTFYLFYEAYENVALDTCSLYINEELNQTKAGVELTNNDVNNFSLINFPEGVYDWMVSCNDTSDNIGNSSTWNFVTDYTNPNITLISPEQSFDSEETQVLFNFSVTDNLADEMICNLTLNEVNVLTNQAVLNNSYFSTTIFDLEEMTYYWNVTCADKSDNKEVSDTRFFNVFIPPVISNLSPDDNVWSNNPSQIFSYHIFDDTGIENCSLILDGEINQTSLEEEINNDDQNEFVVNNLEGFIEWSIVCVDNTTQFLETRTDNRTLNVDLIPPETTIHTLNNTWFNTINPEISFTLLDNMANVLGYNIFVNNSFVLSNTTYNDTLTEQIISGLVQGSHGILIEAFDLALNYKNSSSLNIFVDTEAPIVNLLNPANETIFFTNNVTLNFTASDNLADYLLCDITLNEEIVAENINVSNGEESLSNLTNMTGGYYYWNVSCADHANNEGISDTWWFYVPKPDLTIISENIFFSNLNPEENETINVTATIQNTGFNDADNFTVEFWNGNPDEEGIILDSFLVEGLNSLSETNLTTNITLDLGTTNIYVLVDTPLETNGSIDEENESNNVAWKAIEVSSWHFAFGNTNEKLVVKDLLNVTLFDWIKDGGEGSLLFAVDADSVVSWTTLQALGRDINGVGSSSDFYVLDEALNSTSFSDNVSVTFTDAGTPKETTTLEVFGKNIADIPVTNSTNNDNFKTGILWDYSSGEDTFNGSQNVLFFSEVKDGLIGFNDTYDYEIRIPARLGTYVSETNNKVHFYLEIK